MRLPALLQHPLDAAAREWLRPRGGPGFDFSAPAGEAALLAPDSVCWRIYKNPVSVFVGGVAAVVLELAEPRVRSGVLQHSAFLRDPAGRMRRTGMAVMVTIYGARSAAEAMIGDIVGRHARVVGRTPDGCAYRANDRDLLTWVQATANFGFAEAYSRYVRPLSGWEYDCAFREPLPASRLYGVGTAPQTRREWQALRDAMQDRLQPSPIIFEFLRTMRRVPAFPGPLRPIQSLLVRAAVELVPLKVREKLGLTRAFGLEAFEWDIVRTVGALSDRIVLRDSPAVQACLRVGLPADYLYDRRRVCRPPPIRG